MVTPEDIGYSGLFLKTVSGGGKGLLFIAPLQEQLDTSPLPPDSISFSKMAKATCESCHVSYPLQVLAGHVAICHPDTDVEEVHTFAIEWITLF